MLNRFGRLGSLVRFYGFEDLSEKWTKNWWQYADSNEFGDLTPEEKGYQVVGFDKEANEEWKKIPTPFWQTDIDQYGSNPTKIIDAELRKNPLGDYDPMDQTLPEPEIKTRIFHVLKHFEGVDLRKIDWKTSILGGLKLDEFERIALLTSIEQEFNTVFEDNVFDNLKSLDDIVSYLATDRYVI